MSFKRDKELNEAHNVNYSLNQSEQTLASSSLNNTEDENKDSLEKKRRGRPPKNSTPAKTTDLVEESNKEVNEMGNENENENSAKKSRGRPPKKSSNSPSKAHENSLKNNTVLLNDSLQGNKMDTTETQSQNDLGLTQEKNRRGRKPKPKQVDDNPNEVTENVGESNGLTETPVKKKRGRKPKSLLLNNIEMKSEKKDVKPLMDTQVEGKRARKKISYKFDLDEESVSEEEKNAESSDEEFKIDEKVVEENEDEEDDDDDDDIVDDEDKEDLEIVNKVKSKTSSKRSANNKSSPECSFIDDSSQLIEDDDTPLLDVFDAAIRVEEWEYVLDSQTKSFKRPKLPRLSDDAVKQFISPKSILPKTIIYDCPFCARIFTYTLVFKSHLYMCDLNTNTPDYNILCAKHPECDYKRKKKSDVMQHFIKSHTGKNVNDECDDDDEDQEIYYKTHTKQNQLEVSRYYFLERNVFNFTCDYFRNCLNGNYKNLKFIDDFFADNFYEHSELKIENEREPLKFKYNKIDVHLKPFEMFEHKNKTDQFKLVNVCGQITCLDWCPALSNEHQSQFIAYATSLADLKSEFSVKKLYEANNCIYIMKLSSLHSEKTTMETFAIANKNIGLISSLKWRRATKHSQNNFLGYLLAASSNGNAYINYILDMTFDSQFDKQASAQNLNVFEPKKHIVLKNFYSCGQCTAADWSDCSGAVQIACGYANGLVALFQVNSNFLNDALSKNSKEDSTAFQVYPIKTFSAHLTFLSTLKWSKNNSNILATGSLFSREIKVWDIRNAENSLINYETFVTDFAFSLHSNDLFISKETNLKGENHMCALDLSYNLFNYDKDESRAHSSLFYSYATMTSIDQSDYLNKFLVCDNDGSILMSKSNNPCHWTQKHKIMNFSFAQVAKFEITNKENTEPTYDVSSLEKNSHNSIISLNLDRISNNNHNLKRNQNCANDVSVHLNSLAKVKWNLNSNFRNWYACASLSGFLFFHCLNEINIEEN